MLRVDERPRKLPDAGLEARPVVGDQEEVLAVVTVGNVGWRYVVAALVREQVQPFFEPPSIQQGSLVEQELLNRLARDPGSGHRSRTETGSAASIRRDH